MTSYVEVLAPGKVNLALRVGSARSDGFHPLNTIFLALNIADTVTVRAVENTEITIDCDDEDVSTGEDNIVYQAAMLLREHTGVEKGAHIEITKRIPIAGGMAGGSADGAAALVGLNELWGLGLGDIELSELGADLGSDVPFALLGGCAVGTSRGEDLRPITCSQDLTFVMVRSDEGLSTPQVFAAYDKLHEGAHEPASVLELEEALRLGEVPVIAPLLVNDLEEAAFSLRPDLAELKADLEKVAPTVILSGSGPTMAVLAGDDANSLEATIDAAGLDSFRATGPVPGARIIEVG